MYILQYTSWKIFAFNNSKITKVANKYITNISYLKKTFKSVNYQCTHKKYQFNKKISCEGGPISFLYCEKARSTFCNRFVTAAFLTVFMCGVEVIYLPCHVALAVIRNNSIMVLFREMLLASWIYSYILTLIFRYGRVHCKTYMANVSCFFILFLESLFLVLECFLKSFCHSLLLRMNEIFANWTPTLELIDQYIATFSKRATGSKPIICQVFECHGKLHKWLVMVDKISPKISQVQVQFAETERNKFISMENQSWNF